MISGTRITAYGLVPQDPDKLYFEAVSYTHLDVYKRQTLRMVYDGVTN